MPLHKCTVYNFALPSYSNTAVSFKMAATNKEYWPYCMALNPQNTFSGVPVSSPPPPPPTVINTQHLMFAVQLKTIYKSWSMYVGQHCRDIYCQGIILCSHFLSRWRFKNCLLKYSTVSLITENSMDWCVQKCYSTSLHNLCINLGILHVFSAMRHWI